MILPILCIESANANANESRSEKFKLARMLLCFAVALISPVSESKQAGSVVHKYETIEMYQWDTHEIIEAHKPPKFVKPLKTIKTKKTEDVILDVEVEALPEGIYPFSLFTLLTFTSVSRSS